MKIPIKQQILNAYDRGLAIDIIAECSGKTIEQIRRIIRDRYKTIQGKQESKKTN